MNKEYLVPFDTEEARDNAFNIFRDKIFPYRFQGGKLQPDPSIKGSEYIRLMNTSNDKIIMCILDNSKYSFITRDNLKPFMDKHFSGRYLQGSTFVDVMNTLNSMSNIMEFIDATNKASFNIQF